MKRINGWDQLRPYGIDLLTGEACALVYRGLFDLTAPGLELVRSIVGAVSIQTPSDRNGGEAVGSLLMPYTFFEPLAVFALFQVDKVQHVVVSHKADTYSGVRVIGCSGEERDEVIAVVRALGDFRLLTYPEQRPGVTRGMSNVHQMGGFSN
jgi:hypothetical protein